MTRTAPWTYDDYAALPDDGNRYEIIDGEVCVSPSPGPRHQWVASRLLILLASYVDEHRLGVVLPDIDLLFEPGQFLRPDILFVPAARFDGTSDRGIETRPDLTVEILSPSSGRIDRVKKRKRYIDSGIPEYWIVDPVERTVELVRPGAPERQLGVADRLSWQPEPTIPPLSIALSRVFAEIGQ